MKVKLYSAVSLLFACIPAQSQEGFLYVANSGPSPNGNSISGYSLDNTVDIGRLNPLRNSPFPAGSGPNSIATDPLSRFLYVTNKNDGTVGAYTIDRILGTLTPTTPSTFSAGGPGTQPACATVDPSGQFLYVASFGSFTVPGAIVVYSINQTTGTLSPNGGTRFTVINSSSSFPLCIALDPVAPYAYVLNNGFPGQIVVFKRDPTTGALLSLQNVMATPDNSSVWWITVDPAGRFVYAASEQTSTIWGYKINQTDGTLTLIDYFDELHGVTVNCPAQVIVHPLLPYLFTADDEEECGNIISQQSYVAAFKINQTDGTLSDFGSRVAAGLGTAGVAMDSSGSFLFAANSDPGDNSISRFAFDPSQGLIPKTTGPPANDGPGSQPVKLAFVPSFTDVFQVRYTANLEIADSVLNLTNIGQLVLPGNPGSLGVPANMCVNVYAYDPGEEMISCCSCLVTPNGLKSLSVKTDLVSNSLTPAMPNSVVIKLLASTPAGLSSDGRGGTCNPASPSESAVLGTPGSLAPGLRAWGTSVHNFPTDVGPCTLPPPDCLVAVTETEFSKAVLGSSELSRLTQTCAFIQNNGSGFGICKSCATGGLAAVKH